MSKFRFLLIDDDPEITGLWRRFLKPLDCQVDIAHTLTEGMEMMRTDPRPDILFLDLRLPDSTNDEETLAKIKLFKEIHPFARVIVATGYATDRIKAMAIEMGADSVQDKLDLDTQSGLFCVVKKLMQAEKQGTVESLERQVEILEILDKLVPPGGCRTQRLKP